MKMTVTEHNTAPESAQGADANIDRGVLETLLEDVGPKNAEPVINAFVKELVLQKAVLEEAAERVDPDAMARAAHRLKSTTGSFGAGRLSEVCAFIERSARTGQTEAAVENMTEFRELARASGEELDILRDELFGPAA